MSITDVEEDCREIILYMDTLYKHITYISIFFH